MFYGLSLWLELQVTSDEFRVQNDSLPAAGGRRSPADYLATAANLFMLVLTLIALFGFLAPAYARPPAFAVGGELPNPVDIRFDSFVALRGYSVDTAEVRPGEPIGIELYWEVLGAPPGDYLLFVHLTDDETGALAAQRDTHPGLGNFPSSQWEPGDRFVERLSIYLPETAYAPSAGELTIGLYAPEGYRLGITDGATGEGLGDAYSIGRVAIDPHAPPGMESLPNTGDYNYEDQIRLLGYLYEQRVLAPGEPLEMTLFWEALWPGPGDYEVELTVLDTGNNVLFTQTARPSSGTRPTTDWQLDEVIADTYRLSLDPALAGQDLIVRVVVREAATGRALNRIGDDGRWIDDELFLSAVSVGE